MTPSRAWGLGLLATMLLFSGRADAEPVQTPLFVSGMGGYHTYRIPSLILTKKGALLAFCEGRKRGSGDSGTIHLLAKRSLDGGKTWGKTQIVWEDGANTCGNPCPVVELASGTIWLLMTHNLGSDTEAQIVAGTGKGSRTIWVTRSTDGRRDLVPARRDHARGQEEGLDLVRHRPGDRHSDPDRPTGRALR